MFTGQICDAISPRPLKWRRHRHRHSGGGGGGYITTAAHIPCTLPLHQLFTVPQAGHHSATTATAPGPTSSKQGLQLSSQTGPYVGSLAQPLLMFSDRRCSCHICTAQAAQWWRSHPCSPRCGEPGRWCGQLTCTGRTARQVVQGALFLCARSRCALACSS